VLRDPQVDLRDVDHHRGRQRRRRLLADEVLRRRMRDAFERDGFVRLPGVFGAAEAAAMCARIWDELARAHGIREDDPEAWTVEVPRHLQALAKTDAFAAMGTPALMDEKGADLSRG